jgi:peptidyl-dipeptidase A
MSEGLMAEELPDHPHRLVDALQERFRRLETDFHQAWWDSQVDATPEHEAKRAELELDVRNAKGDPEAFAAVKDALAQEAHEPVLRRCLEVLYLTLASNQMSDEHRRALVELSSGIESDLASFRPVVEGQTVSDNELEAVLKTSDDEKPRRLAWEASKEVGAVVADRVRELARLRNDAARAQGFADYYTMALELQELDEPWLFDVLEDLDRLTSGPFELFKSELDEQLRKRFGASQLYPWHYGDPFFQSLPPDGRISLDALLKDLAAPDLAVRTFAGWGIDLKGVINRSDLYPRGRKSQHAFCLDVDRSGDDVRILANVVTGEKWVEVMLHESGHAAYDVSIDRRLPWLLRRATHTFTTEAAALLSGRLIRDPKWLTDVADIPYPEVDPVRVTLSRMNPRQSLLFARWGLVVVYFERELYSDPEADLDARWWELVQRFQLIEPPPDRAAPDWAAKVHIAAAPAYYHNYLLGDLLAAQLIATCEKEFGGLVGVEGAGRLLVDRLFHPGALLRWDALVEEATGRPLSAGDFAEYVALA